MKQLYFKQELVILGKKGKTSKKDKEKFYDLCWRILIALKEGVGSDKKNGLKVEYK